MQDLPYAEEDPNQVELTRRDLLIAGSAIAAAATAGTVGAQGAAPRSADATSIVKVTLNVNGKAQSLELDTRTRQPCAPKGCVLQQLA